MISPSRTDCPFLVREARPSDMAFVLASWRSSYHDIARVVILRAIHRAANKGELRVACDRQDEDTLIGFSAFDQEQENLEYVYVKLPFQKSGVAKALTDGLPASGYSFRTPDGRTRLKLEERGWEYRPRIVL